MVEVGSLQIGGSVNTQSIEAGLSRVETGLKNVGSAGDSVNSDFVRINQNAKRLGANLKVIAIVGVGAMITLAKGAPAVAGSMAKINISMGKLSRTLGESLKPAFELAADAFGGFVGLIQNNSGNIRSFTTDVVAGLRFEFELLTTAWQTLSSISIPFLDINIGEGLKKVIDVGSKLSLDFFATGLSGLTEQAKSGDTSIGRTAKTIGRAVLPGGGFSSIMDRVTPFFGRLIDSFLGRSDRKSISLQLEDTM